MVFVIFLTLICVPWILQASDEVRAWWGARKFRRYLKAAMFL